MSEYLKCHRCKEWKKVIYIYSKNLDNKLIKKYLDENGNVWFNYNKCPSCSKELEQQYKLRIKKRKSKKKSINRKLANNLRKRLSKVVNRLFIVKSGSAVKDLGCTIDELRIHIESKFQKGMTWKNYGEWHIDHIYPISKVDLSKREELLKVVHYTNLQPLWAIDNLRKGSKVL